MNAAAGVSAPSGWPAELDLRLARRDGRTVLCHNRHRGPLQVQKALYPEGGRTCHLAILHPPGGVASGDRLRIGVVVGARAEALLTTPGATKWYRSDGRTATQDLHLRLEEESLLEWLPRENIFFDGSDLSLSVEVDLAARACYMGWDILSFGRRASGEAWRRGTLRSRTLIRQGGRLLWSEVAHIEAHSGFMHSAAGLAGFTVCGTLLVAGCDIAAALLAACRDLRPAPGVALTGVTVLPLVLVARYLGNSTEEAFQWFTKLWALLRGALAGKAACAPRVWAC